MKKFFIAYSDANCAYSLKRIGKQAEGLGCFDEVVLYTPETLPEFIKSSPLMQYKMGGGMWSWKPAIIKHALDTHHEGDIVVYADAGCSLHPHKDWDEYFAHMQQYDTIVFQYRQDMPEWAQFGQTSPKLKYWCKKSASDYFRERFGSAAFLESNKVLGGIVFAKGKDNSFIRDWMEITMKEPDLVTPLPKEEKPLQIPGFCFHSHDQAVVTSLAFFDPTVLVLPELCETGTDKEAIVASRFRCRTRKDFVKEVAKRRIRKLIGGRLYKTIKKTLRWEKK